MGRPITAPGSPLSPPKAGVHSCDSRQGPRHQGRAPNYLVSPLSPPYDRTDIPRRHEGRQKEQRR